MEIYFINWLFFSLLSIGEKYNLFKNHISKKLLSFVIIILILFIGLRINVGCDWITYKEIFKVISNENIFNLKDGGRIEIGYALINKFISKIGGNIYLSNTIMATLFIVPLTISFKKLKKPFLSFLIAYPYLIIVIGMGPTRQAAAMSLIALSSFYINKNFKTFAIINIFALSLHLSSVFTSIIILFSSRNLKESIRNNWILIVLLLLISISIFYIYTYDHLYYKFYAYLFKTRFKDAKSHIIIWAMNIFPYIILFLNKNINYKRINIFEVHKKVFIALCILPFFSLINTTLTYRLLISFIPYSIFLLTDLADKKLFIPIKFNFYIYNFYSIILLSVWLNFSKHAYCWIPYRINYMTLLDYKIQQLFQ